MARTNDRGARGDVLTVAHFAKAASFQAVGPQKGLNFVGAVVRETAGAASVWRIWRGSASDVTAGSANLLGIASVPAAGIDRFEALPGGGALAAPEGIFAERVSGTADVLILFVPGF